MSVAEPAAAVAPEVGPETVEPITVGNPSLAIGDMFQSEEPKGGKGKGKFKSQANLDAAAKLGIDFKSLRVEKDDASKLTRNKVFWSHRVRL